MKKLHQNIAWTDAVRNFKSWTPYRCLSITCYLQEFGKQQQKKKKKRREREREKKKLDPYWCLRFKLVT